MLTLFENYFTPNAHNRRRKKEIEKNFLWSILTYEEDVSCSLSASDASGLVAIVEIRCA